MSRAKLFSISQLIVIELFRRDLHGFSNQNCWQFREESSGCSERIAGHCSRRHSKLGPENIYSAFLYLNRGVTGSQLGLDGFRASECSNCRFPLWLGATRHVGARYASEPERMAGMSRSEQITAIVVAIGMYFLFDHFRLIPIFLL
jgi:hypothetical protein